MTTMMTASTPTFTTQTLTHLLHALHLTNGSISRSSLLLRTLSADAVTLAVTKLAHALTDSSNSSSTSLTSSSRCAKAIISHLALSFTPTPTSTSTSSSTPSPPITTTTTTTTTTTATTITGTSPPSTTTTTTNQNQNQNNHIPSTTSKTIPVVPRSSSRVCVRLMPHDEAAGDAVRGIDGHPYVEVVLRASKTIWDVIAHLFTKWKLPVRLQFQQQKQQQSPPFRTRLSTLPQTYPSNRSYPVIDATFIVNPPIIPPHVFKAARSAQLVLPVHPPLSLGGRRRTYAPKMNEICQNDDDTVVKSRCVKSTSSVHNLYQHQNDSKKRKATTSSCTQDQQNEERNDENDNSQIDNATNINISEDCSLQVPVPVPIPTPVPEPVPSRSSSSTPARKRRRVALPSSSDAQSKSVNDEDNSINKTTTIFDNDNNNNNNNNNNNKSSCELTLVGSTSIAKSKSQNSSSTRVKTRHVSIPTLNDSMLDHLLSLDVAIDGDIDVAPVIPQTTATTTTTTTNRKPLQVENEKEDEVHDSFLSAGGSCGSDVQEMGGAVVDDSPSSPTPTTISPVVAVSNDINQKDENNQTSIVVPSTTTTTSALTNVRQQQQETEIAINSVVDHVVTKTTVSRESETNECDEHVKILMGLNENTAENTNNVAQLDDLFQDNVGVVNNSIVNNCTTLQPKEIELDLNIENEIEDEDEETGNHQQKNDDDSLPLQCLDTSRFDDLFASGDLDFDVVATSTHYIDVDNGLTNNNADDKSVASIGVENNKQNDGNDGVDVDMLTLLDF